MQIKPVSDETATAEKQPDAYSLAKLS